VYAHVDWIGACKEPRALERAVRARGAWLRPPNDSVPAQQRFQVAVEVQSLAPDPGFTAHLEIESAAGARDQRDLTVSNCRELRSTVAWVLVVLAREPRETSATSGESAAPTSEGKNTRATGAPALRDTRLSLPQHSIDEAPVRGATRMQPNHEASRFEMGAGMVGSFLFLSQPAVGPQFFVGARPRFMQPFGVRLSASQLAQQLHATDSNIDVNVQRTALRLGVLLRVAHGPLFLQSGFEAGVLSGSGLGDVVARRSRSRWGGWYGGVLLDVPLLRNRLAMEVGADAVLTPWIYEFQTSATHTVTESRSLDLRLGAGLRSNF
jgi:hypothetical protein